MALGFTLEQLEFASGHLLDEFANDVWLKRGPSESDGQFRQRIKADAFGKAGAIITLRDYFAAKSINGMLSALDAAGLNYSNPVMMAEHAYAMADAMLAERAK